MERLSDMAYCAMNVVTLALPDSLPDESPSLQQCGSCTAAALQRVNGLLQRQGRSMPPPVEHSLFWAVRATCTSCCCPVACVCMLVPLSQCPLAFMLAPDGLLAYT